jgi:hypothetical protein
MSKRVSARGAGLGDANRRSRLSTQCGGDQKPPVRFWIITMLLVLFGLTTLKLR